MDVGVAEVAERLGVSERRVRQLLVSGRLPARQVSGRWLIDEAAIPRSRRLSRPMSPRVAWAFISLLSDDPVGSLSQPEQSRLRAKHRELLASPEATSLVRSWLPRRARLVRCAVAARDASDLLGDARLVPSGLSDPRSGLSAGTEVEGYVHDDHLAELASDYLLSVAGRANVWLHVADRRLSRPAPIGAVIADLADHDGPREDSQVVSLLRATSP